MGLGKWFHALFSRAVKVFKALLEEALPPVRQELIGLLANVGTEVVRELNDTNLENGDKHRVAFERIAKYAKEEGIAASQTIIDIVIKLAVLKFKEIR